MIFCRLWDFVDKKPVVCLKLMLKQNTFRPVGHVAASKVCFGSMKLYLSRFAVIHQQQHFGITNQCLCVVNILLVQMSWARTRSLGGPCCNYKVFILFIFLILALIPPRNDVTGRSPQINRKSSILVWMVILDHFKPVVWPFISTLDFWRKFSQGLNLIPQRTSTHQLYKMGILNYPKLSIT